MFVPSSCPFESHPFLCRCPRRYKSYVECIFSEVEEICDYLSSHFRSSLFPYRLRTNEYYRIDYLSSSFSLRHLRESCIGVISNYTIDHSSTTFSFFRRNKDWRVWHFFFPSVYWSLYLGVNQPLHSFESQTLLVRYDWLSSDESSEDWNFLFMSLDEWSEMDCSPEDRYCSSILSSSLSSLYSSASLNIPRSSNSSWCNWSENDHLICILNLELIFNVSARYSTSLFSLMFPSRSNVVRVLEEHERVLVAFVGSVNISSHFVDQQCSTQMVDALLADPHAWNTKCGQYLSTMTVIVRLHRWEKLLSSSIDVQSVYKISDSCNLIPTLFPMQSGVLPSLWKETISLTWLLFRASTRDFNAVPLFLVKQMFSLVSVCRKKEERSDEQKATNSFPYLFDLIDIQRFSKILTFLIFNVLQRKISRF